MKNLNFKRSVIQWGNVFEKSMEIIPVMRVALIIMLLRSVYSESNVDQRHCEEVVSEWASSSLEKEGKNDNYVLRDLLFFLHIPRTGGRTYYHCFLRKLYANNQECPRSYDKLRFDPSKQDCKLLVTHDDYSMISKFPEEKVSVVTILRNPVDRVFSSYEFSIEVAARFLVHPNLTSATQMTGRIRNKTGGVSTLDIWPWKYLVPWMREDLFSRREASELNGVGNLRSSNPYNMKEIVMPLVDYINDPVTRDIVHNGATLQIAGLTNNSYFPGAHEIRHCIQKYVNLGEFALKVAKKRLDDMLYVGLTENHRESASMFAHIVGSQVISQSLTSNTSMKKPAFNTLERVSDSKFITEDPKFDQNKETTNESQNPIAEVVEGNMTVGKLMDAYEDCISSLRKSQSKRRSASLKRIAPANFSKQDRTRVSEDVIEKIKALNRLDMELYNYALDLFARQTAAKPTRNDFFNQAAGSLSLTVGLIFALFSLFIFFLSFSAKRRTFKIKL